MWLLALTSPSLWEMTVGVLSLALLTAALSCSAQGELTMLAWGELRQVNLLLPVSEERGSLIS